MPKKKSLQIKYAFECEFEVAVPEDKSEKFKEDTKRDEVSFRVAVHVDETVFNNLIYNDQFKTGGIKISSVENGVAMIKINGEVYKDLDPVFQEDLVNALKISNLPVMTSAVVDSNADSYVLATKNIQSGVAMISM